MRSRTVRISCSVTGIVAVVLATLLSVPGTVLCVARDHIAIEAAHADKCVDSPGKSEDNVPLTVGRGTGKGTCGSCFDIALNGGVSIISTVPAPKAPSLNPVALFPAVAQTVALPGSVLAVSARSDYCATQSAFFSITVLRI